MIHRLTLSIAFAVIGSLLLAAQDACAQESDMLRRGAALYVEQCQDCHGAKGEGVEDSYADPLTGDLTIGELTELISDTMPEGEPEACVAEDAKAVSAFIYESFYSEAARLRNRPPRIALSRLTAEQLRQSLADLYGSMSGSPWTESKRGLKGRYYNGVRRKDEAKKIERIDTALEFDFGRDGPGEGIEPTDFGIVWNGSLIVDRTGKYELVLRSTCSCTMDFGGDRRILINNHVQSAGREEFRRTLYLTGGRAYPMEIEFYQRKRKTEQPPAKVSLSWVPPGGQEEVIPQANLMPVEMPDTFALQAKLPPDDRSYGYERGTSVDRTWDESTTAAALEFAEIAADELYPTFRRRNRNISDENRERLKTFLQRLVETAFRGPIDDATKQLYIDRQIEAVPDDADAIKRVLLITLKSPRFLYPSLPLGQSKRDEANSRQVANRLALVLFDSLPSDNWLIQRADKDQLKNDQQIRQAAQRMVKDLRVQAKARGLITSWFDLSDMEELVKEDSLYKGFDQALVSDLRVSFDRFVDAALWGDTSDFRQLLQADWMYTSPRIAAFYGKAFQFDKADGEATEAPGRSVSDRKIHVGLLTHPLVLSHLAYHDTSSPIHRGVFLTRHVLGRVLRPPNEAFTPLDPDLHPKLTTRQRIQLQTGEVNCQVCHSKINSLGFALENFDAAGRFRLKEGDLPIDASGSYITRSGETVRFDGARELGDFLAESEDVHRAIVEATFEHFVKQPINAFGRELADELTESFRQSGFDFRELIVSIAVIAANQPPPELPST
ncbi:MAG: DUF1588 domain-containing protein [Planctomycetota bacterium]